MDDVFWLYNWIVIVVGCSILGVCAKSCNDSDNQLFDAATKRGCSVRSSEHGHQILCGKDRAVDQIKD
jgi:hypothetical protein